MRSTPLRAKPPEARAAVALEPCKVCRKPFAQFSTLRPWCSPECGAKLGVKLLRQAKAEKAQEKRADRAKREALKTLPELRKEAQTAFNAYIRARDRAAGYGCICCGRPLNWVSDKPGGEVDAGHYMSRGSCPELAFDERNVNAQAKACNRPGGTTRAEFRAGMVVRWGRAVVEELEGPHPPAKLRHDDYRVIRATYRVKLRGLNASRD